MTSGVEMMQDEWPVEVTIHEATHQFAGAGTARLQGYEVRATHVFKANFDPGLDEMLVIVSTENLPAVHASEASPFGGGLEFVEWPAASK